MQITAEGLFKVNIHNGNLEGLEKVKIINNLNIGMDMNSQTMLDNEKLELKEYTKEAVRYRDGLEIVEKIASKQFTHDGAHTARNRQWIQTSCLSMPEYKTIIAAAFNVLPVNLVVST